MASSSTRGRQKEAATSSVEDQPAGQTYLQNPYYLMNATLVRADNQQDLHLLKDGKTRYTLGSTVSSLFQLKDEDKTDAGFFVFPDLSVRVEGDYRLKLDLYEIVVDELHYCQTIVSEPFQVYTAKRFPGNQQSTSMTKLLSAQGIKVRTHHAAAPARPASARKLSTSSSKRKVDISNESSSAMVKSESSSSGPDSMKTLERRNSAASSKRPRTAGGSSIHEGHGRPSSQYGNAQPLSHHERPGSWHSQHEQGAPPPVSWGPPPPPGVAYPHYLATPPHPSAHPAAHYHRPRPSQQHVYYPTPGADPRYAPRNPHVPRPPEQRADAWARQDLRLEEAWSSGSGPVPMEGQVPTGAPQGDPSRPSLPPISSVRPLSQGRPGSESYPPPPSSSGSGGPPPFFAQLSLNDPRNSVGGSSEGSFARSSVSSVWSERFSVSSERPSDRHSFSSDPSSYISHSLGSDAQRQGTPYDLASRYSSSVSRNPGMPSINSLTTETSARDPQQPYPSSDVRGTSAGSSGLAPSLPPLSSVPRLPSLSEMMSQSPANSPLATPLATPREVPPMQETRSQARPITAQTSPDRAPPSRSGRMGLSNLLASPKAL